MNLEKNFATIMITLGVVAAIFSFLDGHKILATIDVAIALYYGYRLYRLRK